MKIIVIGDVIVDTNHICTTTRNAPEANIPVYNVIATHHILGGAANVAKNLANLGCDIEIVSIIGDDIPGANIIQLFLENNIENRVFREPGRKTTHKTRTFCDNRLVNRYDIEDTGDISSEMQYILVNHIKSQSDVSAIVFSDYNKGVLTPYVCEELIAYAGANHIYTFVDPKPSRAIKYKNCFCFKLNLLEAETLSRKTSKHDIIRYLKEYIQCQHIILTCGEHGIYIDSVEHHITSAGPVDVIDVTGCGDIVLAVSTFVFLKTRDILWAGKLANHVARKCVSNIGNAEISHGDIDDFVDTIVYDHETDKLTRLSKMGKPLVFTNGCFDIVHSAHIQLLQFAKKLGDILIVGINSDASVRRLKGESRPINDVVERCRLLTNLGIIDYIVIFSDDTPLDIVRVLQPSIIVKGGDYTKENIVGAEYAEEVVIYDYVAGISSTNTISKISGREERRT